jgi:hypothetical protein
MKGDFCIILGHLGVITASQLLNIGVIFHDLIWKKTYRDIHTSDEVRLQMR